MNTAIKDLVAETREKNFERSQVRVRQMTVQGFAEFSRDEKNEKVKIDSTYRYASGSLLRNVKLKRY